jgi:HK97 gp10 family phage protein
MSSIQVISHVRQVKRSTDNAMKRAAHMIGGTIESHAKEYCPVDTGLLRNSITYAIGGEEPQITLYRSNSRDKTGKEIEPKEGIYTDRAEQDHDNQVTVYVGTNVQYAPYQELGAPNINLPARPYLRPAFENHKVEIEQIIEQVFGRLS